MTQHPAEIINELPSDDRARLHQLWRDLYGRPAPPKLRREWLIRILAYRIQEKIFGGLSNESQKRLLEVGRLLEKSPRATLLTSYAQPGAQLVRQWKGESHIVTTATNGGYEYRNRHYKSLSEIARLITGTRWSGPLFFGVKKHGKGKSQ